MTSDLKLKPSDVLAKAADLIEPEGAWTRRWYARAKATPRGAHRDPKSPDAVCWCALGAIERAGPSWEINHLAQEILRKAISPSSTPMRGMVHRWNDAPGRTQAEVVAALRKASTLAREAGE